MSSLESAMAILLHTFDKYANSDGVKETMSQSEVKTLIEKELPGLVKVRYSPWEGRDSCFRLTFFQFYRTNVNITYYI
uniref:S100/CaBP-9k-type calcium binding subdomain domain-containing protein n=1 Tax=Cyprinodon variegatus TaxID=28743 RepID=A0A3Q2DBQ0_CYPVA